MAKLRILVLKRPAIIECVELHWVHSRRKLEPGSSIVLHHCTTVQTSTLHHCTLHWYILQHCTIAQTSTLKWYTLHIEHYALLQKSSATAPTNTLQLDTLHIAGFAEIALNLHFVLLSAFPCTKPSASLLYFNGNMKCKA